jgi:hypothetical protein
MLSPEQIQEVRDKVWLADQAMAQRDHELFCKRIWQATAHAIKCVARERGWPCGNFEEIWNAGRRLAVESDNEFGWTSALGSAELLRTNGQGLVQEPYEIEEDWDISTSFINRLLGFSVRNVK